MNQPSCPNCQSPLSPDRQPLCPCGADLGPAWLAFRLGQAELDAAQRALQGGRYRAALGHLQAAAAWSPAEGRLGWLKGLALLGAGRPGAARPLLLRSAAGARLLEAAADLVEAEARYLKARGQAAAGDLSGAAATLSAGPATGDGLVLFGLCALHLGDPTLALMAFVEALRADPSNLHAAALLRL